MSAETWRIIAVILFVIDAVLNGMGDNRSRGVLLPLGLAFFAASFVAALTKG